jgi:hypothetical protein
MGPLGVLPPPTEMGLRALANRATLNQFDQLQRLTTLRSALGRRAIAACQPQGPQKAHTAQR